MTLWPLINMLASMTVAGIITYKLGWRSRNFSRMECTGMALTGSGCLLTIGPIMSIAPSPFEDWSATLMRIGLAVYFIGRILKHRHNNAAAVRAARRHLESNR